MGAGCFLRLPAARSTAAVYGFAPVAARVRHPLPSRLQYINSERDIDDQLKCIKPLSREPNLAATRDRFLKMFF